MNLNNNEYPTELNIKSKIRRTILFSVGATICVSLAISQIARIPNTAENVNIFRIFQNITTHNTKANELISIYINLSQEKQYYFLENYVKSNPPNQILKIVTILFRKKDPIIAGPLALDIANRAADLYKYNRLRILVAAEYIKGISLEKNFSEARSILELSELRDNSLASYYRGIWWSDKTNPSYDLDRAKIHLRKSIDLGNKSAEKMLNKLGK